MSDLHEYTIARASSEISAGRMSALSFVESFLRRINNLEPFLKAWVTIDGDRALIAAEELDKELAEKGPRGPLHGIPVGIKDIYYTNGLKTTACSKIYADFVPSYDATSVARLRDAGAIILGKTVTTEFASGDPPPTINPWDKEHTPGGSSSGSAVAVSVRMCPAAMGSQTGGSIIRPASYNGVVGLKPTFGRISCFGVIPLAWSLDTIGPMTNSVEDAAIMLQVLAGYDASDPGSSEAPVGKYLSTVNRLETAPRIGLIKEFFFGEAVSEVRAHTLEIAEALSRAGATVEEIALPPSFSTCHAAHWIVNHVETATYHEENHRTRPQDYSDRLRERIEIGFLTPATQYLQAQRLRRVYRREMESLAREWDVLLMPTTPTAAPRDLSTTGDPIFQSPWTSCGLPTITLPSGISPSTGLPLGIQLAAESFAEVRLLAVARWCERVLDINLTPPQVNKDNPSDSL